jgi:hypothetical protein
MFQDNSRHDNNADVLREPKEAFHAGRFKYAKDILKKIEVVVKDREGHTGWPKDALSLHCKANT